MAFDGSELVPARRPSVHAPTTDSRTPDTLVDGVRHGENLRGFVPYGGGGRHDVLDMREVARALEGKAPPEAAVVYAVSNGALGPVTGGTDMKGNALRGPAPGQLPAYARQQPTITPWGRVRFVWEEDSRTGLLTRVLSVEPPAELPAGG